MLSLSKYEGRPLGDSVTSESKYYVNQTYALGSGSLLRLSGTRVARRLFEFTVLLVIGVDRVVAL